MALNGSPQDDDEPLIIRPLMGHCNTNIKLLCVSVHEKSENNEKSVIYNNQHHPTSLNYLYRLSVGVGGNLEAIPADLK